MSFDAFKLPHEPSGIRMRRVLAFAMGFVGFVIVLFGGLGLFYHFALVPGREPASFKPFPEPQLQSDAFGDYARFYAAQLKQLEGTAWVDRASGLVHVPIERAMHYEAGRGAAAYDPIPGS